MEFKTLVGYPDALRLQEHLGIKELGEETDQNTKVYFKIVEERGYRFVKVSMEL